MTVMASHHHVIVRFQLNSEQELFELVNLINELEEIVKTSPDFISAKLHRNVEGTVLINYATWTSPQAYESFWKAYVVDTETNKKIKSYKPMVDQVFALQQ